MPIKLAILGLDPIQQDWLHAVSKLRNNHEVELVAAGHRTMALAKDLADVFEAGPPPAYDDLRLLLQETAPQIILMDRPANATLEFLQVCAAQEIGIFSLGPPVENLTEAHALAESLQPRTHLLYTWPRFTDSYAYRHCAQADDFVRPIRFAAAQWFGMNHPLAKTSHISPANSVMPVRSLSVLAWDAFATLISLIDLPTSIYASIRGTVASGDSFADITGAAAITLRFPEDACASLTISDRIPAPARRDLLLTGQNGTVKLEADNYEFRDPDGLLIDSGRAAPILATTGPAETLRTFLQQYASPPSPHRGWEHRLDSIAACLEALIVSHRTGQPESPEKFLHLRR